MSLLYGAIFCLSGSNPKLMVSEHRFYDRKSATCQDGVWRLTPALKLFIFAGNTISANVESLYTATHWHVDVIGETAVF